MIMKKILIFVLSLIMTVSLVGCGNGNNGGQQGNPESTPDKKEPISMSAEEIYSAVENLYNSDVIDLDMTHTRFMNDLSSTNSTNLVCRGFASGDFEYYIKNKVGIRDFTDNIYVGGILYTNYGSEIGEIKIKTEKVDYQAKAEFMREFRAYPELSDFDKSEISSDSERATLTLTGISADVFYELVLGIKPEDFDSMTEYEQACGEYEFDSSKYVLSISVNEKGELVEITEDYSYDYSANGKTAVSYGVKTKTVRGNNIAKIKAPDDADSYIGY